MDINDYAIILENISRGYGSDIVIDELNLKIKKGTLNSLIGSSGSGKTTILKTILGKLKPENGNIFIFGKEPHQKYSNVPGSDIGYAPQEVSLYTEITIEENLSFFASIHNMSKELFIQRRDYLKELLELPDLSKTVSQLSGGQQRRVSLAIALLHSPKLLILDEPTVGVCPLVSSNIWKHLHDLVKKEGVTILITTHYLQECRQSDTIFLLRNGKILEKGAPDYLLLKYDCKLLEDVYYKLCRSDEDITVIEEKSNAQRLQQQPHDLNEVNIQQTIPLDNISNSGAMQDVLITSNIQPLEIENNETNSTIKKYYRWNQTKTIFRHSFAISKRKLTQLYRFKSFLLFELFVPTILTVLFFLSIGNLPKDLKFGIVNQDTGDLSNQLLSNIMSNPNTIFQLKRYDNLNDTINDIESSKLYGSMYFPANYSDGIINRLFDPMAEMVPDSELEVYMDLANFQVNLLFDIQILNAFEKISNNSGLKMKPFVQHAIYGDRSAKFNWFLSPAIIGIILYCHAMSFLAIAFVREKLDGTRDRLQCYGVNSKSFFLGHLLGHAPIIFFQFSILLLISFYAFQVPMKGNVVLVYLFIYLLLFIAIGQGMLIGIFCRSETEAIQLVFGSFFCSLFLSGIIWPVEAIIKLGFISNLIPSTWSSLALRGIMIKNLPFSHVHVWRPFIILVSWIILLFILVDLLMPIRETNFNFKKILNNFKRKKNNKQ